MITKPKTDTLLPYFKNYIDKVKTEDLLQELKNSQAITHELMLSITPEMENYAYEKGKWTLKEVLRHINDAERIFAYRALRLSRLDATPLAGFDENSYIENTKELQPSMQEITAEFQAIRESSILLFSQMSDKMLDFEGIANNSSITARAIGYILVGHNVHHYEIIQKKYLNL